MAISMDELGRRFASAYDALYRTRDGLAGYREAVEAFDAFASRNGDVVAEFARHRGDFVSSDREAAAFMMAVWGA